MNDLRKAAEMAVEMFDWLERRSMYQDLQMKETHEALRQALAHEALDRMVAENQRLGLYDEDNLQTAIEKGTKAWADVPANWVEELRGDDTPEVTGEVTTEVLCKTHPDAPHGFDRNASHSEDRYVCECEGWEPVDNVDMSEKRVHKTDKSIHEPVGWVKIDEVRQYLNSVGCGTIYKIAGEDRVPLYAEPYTKLDTTAGVLHKEWVDRLVRIMGTFDLATGHADTLDQALDSLEEELRDVLGHLRARRQWVGLTDEEIAQYWGDTHAGNTRYVQSFARALEATLKEKNGE